VGVGGPWRAFPMPRGWLGTTPHPSPHAVLGGYQTTGTDIDSTPHKRRVNRPPRVPAPWTPQGERLAADGAQSWMPQARKARPPSQGRDAGSLSPSSPSPRPRMYRRGDCAQPAPRPVQTGGKPEASVLCSAPSRQVPANRVGSPSYTRPRVRHIGLPALAGLVWRRSTPSRVPHSTDPGKHRNDP
jgi:hypothetical protein